MTNLSNTDDWYDFTYGSVSSTVEPNPLPVGTYYPVCYATFESNGDLKHRIRMIYALTLVSFMATESEADRKFNSKAFWNKVHQVGFQSCPAKEHLAQYPRTGRRSQHTIPKPRATDAQVAVRVIGYQVITTGRPDYDTNCYTGLAEARSGLMFRNGDPYLRGVGIINDSSDVIDSLRLEDPQAPWNQDTFDTGVCTCPDSSTIAFNRNSLLRIQ